MESIVIYSRVSTEEQDFTSQIEDLKKYVKNRFKLDKVFAEKVSGFDLSKDRVQYDNMKRHVVEHNIKHIITWELSRFGRSALHTLNEIDYFSKQGVNIFFYKENLNTISDEKTGQLLLHILTSMAQMERDSFIERSIRGRIMSVSRGRRTGYAIMPYGYKDVDGYVAIDEEEAVIVREMFESIIKGVGPGKIVTMLNARGVQTRQRKRGKKRVLKNGKEVDRVWKMTSVNSIIHNELYKGVRIYSNNKFKVAAIVDEATWDKAQDYYTDNVGYMASTSYEYLFKGKIRCGYCLSKYGSRTETRYKNLKQYYYCYGKMDMSIKCLNGQSKSSVFDKYVYDLLFRHEQIMVSIYKDSIKDFSIEEKQSEIVFYTEQIQKEELKKKRVIQIYKDGYSDEDEYRKDLETIRNNIVKFENDISSTEREIKLFSEKEIDNIERFKELRNEDDFNIKKEFVDKYINEILIYKVQDNRIDFSELVYWDLGIDTDKPVKRQLRNPNKVENLVYLEVFAFGNKTPVKVVLSSQTDICYSSNELQYKDGTLELN
jgi:DNA invertase Pin-like site-specific DNA recombinase